MSEKELHNISGFVTNSEHHGDSISALLGAGAKTDGIDLPTGYDAIDQLLLGRLNKG